MTATRCPRLPVRFLGPSLFIWAAACTGSIQEPAGPGGDPGGDDDPGNPPAQCEASAEPAVGEAPLRRLTRLEYDNTVRDLLGDSTAPAREFSPDETAGGYYANGGAAVTENQLEDYYDAAASLASRAVQQHVNEWLPCDREQTSCVRPFIGQFGRRAFRRPLSSAELDSFVALYEASRGQWDGVTGVELVVQAMLASPHFLYHVELGAADGSGGTDAVALSGYEVASRLSYFLWSSMPDNALLDAAEAGDLATATGVATHAQRMLADPRARATVETFHEQWLELGELEELIKDDSLFPAWTPELAAAMRAETMAFVDQIIRGQGDGRLSTLLTAPFTYVFNPALAALYGNTPPAADGRLELDPSQRAGLLTQASLLASHSHPTEVSWVHRGKFVRERLLCDPLDPPPPGVDSNTANDTSRLTDAACSGCHLKMDPIGFGFDAYSPIGQFRQLDDHGQPVDDHGEILDPDNRVDIDGEFTGAVDLAQRLAGSDAVRDCVALQWFRFATRRVERAADACSIYSVDQRFNNSGGDIRDLLIAIATTDAFRYRTAIAAQ